MTTTMMTEDNSDRWIDRLKTNSFKSHPLNTEKDAVSIEHADWVCEQAYKEGVNAGVKFQDDVQYNQAIEDVLKRLNQISTDPDNAIIATEIIKLKKESTPIPTEEFITGPVVGMVDDTPYNNAR